MRATLLLGTTLLIPLPAVSDEVPENKLRPNYTIEAWDGNSRVLARDGSRHLVCDLEDSKNFVVIRNCRQILTEEGVDELAVRTAKSGLLSKLEDISLPNSEAALIRMIEEANCLLDFATDDSSRLPNIAVIVPFGIALGFSEVEAWELVSNLDARLLWTISDLVNRGVLLDQGGILKITKGDCR